MYKGGEALERLTASVNKTSNKNYLDGNRSWASDRQTQQKEKYAYVGITLKLNKKNL